MTCEKCKYKRKKEQKNKRTKKPKNTKNKNTKTKKDGKKRRKKSSDEILTYSYCIFGVPSTEGGRLEIQEQEVVQ